MRFFLKIGLVFIGVLSSQTLHAQFSYSEKVAEAQEAILNLNFQLSDSIIESFTVDEEGLAKWLLSYKSFLEFKTSSRQISDDSLIVLQKRVVREIQELKTESPYYFYCLADVYLISSYLFVERSEYLKAFQNYSSAKLLINKYHSKYPEFTLGYKHELFQIVVNQVFANQFGLDGERSITDYRQFVSSIKIEQSGNSVFFRELKLLSVLVSGFHNGLLHEDKIVHVNKDFAIQGPLESLVSALEFRKNKEYYDQGEVLKSAYSLGFFDNLNMLNLWYGDYLLNQISDSTIWYLDTFLNRQKNNRLVNYTCFKMAMYYFINDEVNLADSLVNYIKSNTHAETIEDKQAVYEITHASSWTKELLKSRLLFDGGNYDEALATLLKARNNIPEYTKEQKLEYSYRLGRIYHMKNELNKARIFYEMVIHSNMDKQFYYPCYSAYFLGEIYTKLNKPEKAFYYYTLCIELDSPIYKSSIHKKAEQRLDE